MLFGLTLETIEWFSAHVLLPTLFIVAAVGFIRGIRGGKQP